MNYFYTAAALLAATASADLCAHGSTDDNGNWYCQQVNAISYTNVGGSNQYNRVTNMDSNSGACSSTPQSYSGSLAPLDEEVSMHFRGPLNLKQFAFYAPSSSSSKRSNVGRKSAAERRHAHAHGHAHAHLHKGREAHEERALGDIVTAVIDGVVQTWANNWSGEPTSAPAAAPAPAATSAPAAPAYSAPDSSSSSSSDSDNSGSNFGGTGWTRQAYYNAEQGTADGVVFLNHEGGSGSGVFDYRFGNSLSYASADGASGSASPQTLADTTLASSTEVVIMTDNECNGDCGYVRDGTVAYHGFDGPSKAFFFEFEMPNDGQYSASKYDAVNMPAIWLLNAQIPRTLQYGEADCSCWTTGCGEFDIFEVLAPGDSRCKSTLHGNIAGGDSDYFLRPENGTIKAALLLYNDNIHIKILGDDDFDFGTTMGSTFVEDICADTLVNSLESLTSLFSLSG